VNKLLLRGPLTPEEKVALWREFLETVPKAEYVIDDSHGALYEGERGADTAGRKDQRG
jgi:hypothetical protein